MTNSSKQKAFSLIEVLISMFILAIGLLGLMSLQLQALKGNNNSGFRTVATIAAYDMSERIRANIPGYTAGSYNAISAGNGTGSSTVCTACSSSQLAANDAQEWHEDLASSLPEGNGTVAVAAGNDGLNITVTWKELDNSGTAVDKDFVLRARFN